MSAFSESLRRLRKAQGLTQEQLATTLYVTRQTISNWENDRAQPDYQMLSTVASVLNVPVSTLLGEEAHPDVSPLPTESPEPAVLPAQPEFILPECDPLPVLSPDEQAPPDTHPSKKRRLSSPALILTAALLILLPLLSNSEYVAFCLIYQIQSRNLIPHLGIGIQRGGEPCGGLCGDSA